MKKRNLSSNQPVTQKPFDSAMTAIKQEFDLIRDDMKGMATKKDLKRYATKADVERLIDKGIQRIMDHIDVVVENRFADLGGAKIDQVTLLKHQTTQLDRRVTVLERHTGLPPA